MGPVLVLGNGGKPAVVDAVEEHTPRLEREFGIAAVDLNGGADLSGIEAAWAIVFGGDGAILSASRRMGDDPIPTLAVNFGRLGFLTEVEAKQLPDALDRIAEGKLQMHDRMRLRMELGDRLSFALNEVVFASAVTGRLIHVAAKIEGRDALRYAGDGVVIATPTGSTAYSLAAGGPILDPALEATVITPLAAHTLSQRPIVIPADHRIQLRLEEKKRPGAVVIDGQDNFNVSADDVVHVRKAGKPLQLIRVGLKSYYARLRRILGWGGRPKYNA
ncbi:MAG: NAD(+)/NADH kinase [Planctomycetota bacterium]|jgi:NAD+ kinase